MAETTQKVSGITDKFTMEILEERRAEAPRKPLRVELGKDSLDLVFERGSFKASASVRAGDDGMFPPAGKLSFSVRFGGPKGKRNEPKMTLPCETSKDIKEAFEKEDITTLNKSNFEKAEKVLKETVTPEVRKQIENLVVRENMALAFKLRKEGTV